MHFYSRKRIWKSSSGRKRPFGVGLRNDVTQVDEIFLVWNKHLSILHRSSQYQGCRYNHDIANTEPN